MPVTWIFVVDSGEEQRFDFGVSDQEIKVSPKRHESAEELVARVEAVHAAASRVRSRRRQVSDAADAYLAEFPFGEVRGAVATGGVEAQTPPGETKSAPRPDGVTDRSPEFEADGETLDDVDDALTIAAFYERVRRALSAEFSDEVWVVGEIRGLRESRGHRYLELADAGSDSPGGRAASQQLEVVCWSREWPAIARSLADAGVELEVGRVVRVRGKVSVWEGGSKLRFTLTSLDVDALLGGIAAARRRLLLALEEEGLLRKNALVPISPVPLRVGLVTSPGSEAHRDFVGQLERSGFAFTVHLEPSLVQGADAPGQLVAAIARLEQFAPDIGIIVRGGGARGDLAAFDSEEVARAIANAPFAIWSGIGHTGDHSVADDVVHSAWITPTACGEALVARVTAYWESIEERAKALVGLVVAHLRSHEGRVTVAERELRRSANYQVVRRTTELDQSRKAAARAVMIRLRGESEHAVRRGRDLQSRVDRALAGALGEVTRRRQVLRAFDPTRQFERGWSLTHRGGVLIRSAAELGPGDVIVTKFRDGEVDARIERIGRATRPIASDDRRTSRDGDE